LCFLLLLSVPAAPGRAEMNVSEDIKHEDANPAAPDSSAETKTEEPAEQAQEGKPLFRYPLNISPRKLER